MALKKLLAALPLALSAPFVHAQAALDEAAGDLPSIGKPEPLGVNFQPAVTELASDIRWLDNMLLIIITAISVFVVVLLAICLVRYNARANDKPATFTHNTPIEIAWTLGPVLVLVFIGAFSLPVLFKQQEIPEADVTIKVTGYQWYWGYEYVDHEMGFESFMIGSKGYYVNGVLREGEDFRLSDVVRADLETLGYAEDEFLLATDTAVVVPVNKTIVMQVTGADVIHSWTIPAFGVKQDAVPGRLAELWFKAEQEGVYFGQCSELCGFAHAYMPITVKVVSQEAYEAWLAAAIDEYGGDPESLPAFETAMN
ncbi:MAG: cytochrome c oxidase subunit II [Pseudomonadota bacterium]